MRRRAGFCRREFGIQIVFRLGRALLSFFRIVVTPSASQRSVKSNWLHAAYQVTRGKHFLGKIIKIIGETRRLMRDENTRQFADERLART